MKYLKYTHVDAVTGISVTEAPAANGPAEPFVEGLEFGFALESEYPTNTPTFYGTAPDDSELDVSGVISVVTQVEFGAAQAAEMATRAEQQKTRTVAAITTRRYQAEISGTTVSGMQIDTQRESQAMLTGAALAASLDLEYAVQWKTAEGFVSLTAAQILGLASAVRAHVQACFDREAMLLIAVNDGSITTTMIDEGWPA